MPVITVRAPTSQKAMAEILRRLGPDALILSTRKIDGQFELRASGEAVPADAPEIRTETRNDTGLAMAPPVIAPPTATVQPAAGPDLPALLRPALRASRDPSPFERSFRAANTRASARPTPGDPLADLSRRLFFATGLDEPIAPRTVIVGPPGAGKSLLAARLAARILTTDRRLQPRLIAPAPGLMLTEDRLRGWTRLMGLRLDRPTVQSALNAPEPDPAFPEIFDLSDTADQMPALAARLIDSDDTDLILCLPAGTQPALTARLCRDWSAFQPIVCLTRLDLWEPDIPELHAIADAGLKLGLIASGTGIVNALRRPGPADLVHWSGGWAAQQGFAAE